MIKMLYRAKRKDNGAWTEGYVFELQPGQYVTIQKNGLQVFKNLINALPDGFPLPMKRRDNHDGEGSNKNI